MNLNTTILNFFISGILLMASNQASSATVEINFIAEITHVSAGVTVYSDTSDESWIDTVNNTILVGDALTGTFKYHTNPDPDLSTPGSGIYIYTDPLAYLSFETPASGLIWSSSILGQRPLRLDVVDGGSRDVLDVSGYGSDMSFPDQLYRNNSEAINTVDLNLRYIDGFTSESEIPLSPINMSNFFDGSGTIQMHENLQTDFLGDSLYISFNVTNVNTTITSVPLPSSLLLAISGLLCLLGFVKKTQKPGQL